MLLIVPFMSLVIECQPPQAFELLQKLVHSSVLCSHVENKKWKWKRMRKLGIHDGFLSISETLGPISRPISRPISSQKKSAPFPKNAKKKKQLLC
jgi:hypothetical protein